MRLGLTSLLAALVAVLGGTARGAHGASTVLHGVGTGHEVLAALDTDARGAGPGLLFLGLSVHWNVLHSLAAFACETVQGGAGGTTAHGPRGARSIEPRLEGLATRYARDTFDPGAMRLPVQTCGRKLDELLFVFDNPCSLRVAGGARDYEVVGGVVPPVSIDVVSDDRRRLMPVEPFQALPAPVARVRARPNLGVEYGPMFSDRAFGVSQRMTRKMDVASRLDDTIRHSAQFSSTRSRARRLVLRPTWNDERLTALGAHPGLSRLSLASSSAPRCFPTCAGTEPLCRDATCERMIGSAAVVAELGGLGVSLCCSHAHTITQHSAECRDTNLPTVG